MIQFACPAYLLLALASPLILVFYAVAMYLRRKKIRRMGDSGMVEALMPSYSASRGWVKTVLLTLGVFFIAVAMARPQSGARLATRQTKGAEIMIALDVSNSMLAQDYSPSRIERAKMSISRLVDRLQEDRIGLVIFAGKSFVQLPVTADYVSAKSFLSSISTSSVPVQGTALGEAILTCVKSFSTQSENARAIIVITDGENHEDDAVKAAQEAASMGIKVFTIGVGTAKGSLISTGAGDYIKDRSGNPVVTKLNEKLLMEIASAGSGAYIHASSTDFGLGPILSEIQKMQAEEFSSIVFEEYDEQYMYFLAVGLLLLALEMVIGSRRGKRRLF